MNVVNKQIIKLFVLCEVFCFIYILIQGRYTSDYFGIEINSSYGIILIYFIVIVSLYWLYYYFWDFFSIALKSSNHFRSLGNVNVLMLLLSCIYFIFVFQTGVGRISSTDGPAELSAFEKIIYSPIIVFKFNFLIYIYAAGNKYKNKTYYIAILLFIASELFRGVSFTILLFSIIEYKKIKGLITKRNFILLIPFTIIFINLVYNLKYYVRLGDKYEYLSVYETFIMLVGRLSLLSNVIFVQDNYKSFEGFLSGYRYIVFDEFFEKLTPMPSLFGINDKVIEFGKLIFAYSNGSFNSATAVSVISIMYFFPNQIIDVISILMISVIFVIFITNRLYNHREQNTVAFFFVFLTLYQGFWGILANYVYALFMYFILIAISYLLPKREKNG
ncbi:oligosaccharide repeat unit polymerase [Hafnia paralvei]|uniref:oligosaccharide repeat unit polymerase n=1 Tax=Hafnia paralvei TaxID=546367 RepID=UPI00300D23CA